jgi:hypothetical protein
MSQAAPPIVQLAERVLVELEQVVRLFPRYHKYAVGADLREQARIVARLAHRAWRDGGSRGTWLERLVFGVDDLKLSLQIAQRIKAFRSFAQFEAVARLVSDLGRQCGGWQKQHRQGLYRPAQAGAGRAQILRGITYLSPPV